MILAVTQLAIKFIAALGTMATLPGNDRVYSCSSGSTPPAKLGLSCLYDTKHTNRLGYSHTSAMVAT